MLQPGTPSLDQLRVLIAVVEAGSLAAAGRRLGRATSAISYAIDNLEAQLGLAVFRRSGTKKPELTEAGQVVLAEARGLARGMDGLRARVSGLLEGLEAEVSLAVDVMLPTARLVAALTAFQAEFPTVGLRLHVEALGAVPQLLAEGRVRLAVGGPLSSELPEAEMISLAGVAMIPVAAPGHPLTVPGLPAGAARDHLQLVLTDRSPLTKGRDFGVLGERSWRLADLGAKHALLRAGAGWGNMPEPMVAEDLASGRLLRLALPDWPGTLYPLTLLHRRAEPPGPAARRLMALLAADQDKAAA
jgi:DNA-binding transcriptional LysR family regulator